MKITPRVTRDFVSIPRESPVFVNSPYRVDVRLVYLTCLLLSDVDGFFRVKSHGHLAEIARVKPARVRPGLRELRDAGLLTVNVDRDGLLILVDVVKGVEA